MIFEYPGRKDAVATTINHEAEPHCIGCYNIFWNNGSPYAMCNECLHTVHLLDQLSSSVEEFVLWSIFDKNVAAP